MYITKIRLMNFRNYEKLHIEGLDRGVNMIYGKNAQGKTNLIEAVNICANGKSFRINTDAKAIRFGCESAYISAEYEKNGKKNTMEVLIEKNKKSFKHNGIPVKRLKDMLGNLYVVVFSPEDIKMAKESPSLRRAFLDGEISKIRPSYVDALKKYTKIIAEKNATLRNLRGAEDIVRAYNLQLRDYVRIILKNRLSYVNKLNEYVQQTHKIISGGQEKIEIRYRATIQDEDIEGQLEKLIKKEIADFGVAAGPHRDDLDIRINDKDIRIYASQGQLRTLMLAIKIACLKILEESVGHTPVLLLDDVFSELDEQRKQNLLKSLVGIQVFLTTADEKDANRLRGGGRYRVEDGKVRPG